MDYRNNFLLYVDYYMWAYILYVNLKIFLNQIGMTIWYDSSIFFTILIVGIFYVRHLIFGIFNYSLLKTFCSLSLPEKYLELLYMQ